MLLLEGQQAAWHTVPTSTMLVVPALADRWWLACNSGPLHLLIRDGVIYLNSLHLMPV